MNRLSQVCWVLMLAGAFGVITLVVTLKFRRQEKAQVERNQQVAELRNELQTEQHLRVQAELDGSKAAQEATTLRQKLQQLESDKAQWEQLTREQDASRQKVAAPQRQDAAAGTSVPGIAASQVHLSQPAPRDNAPPSQKERFEAYLCASHLFQIALAAGQWADAHDDTAPPDFLSLKEYLAPMILICPSETPQSVALSWVDFDPATISYRCRLPSSPSELRWRRGGSRVFAGCPFHGTVVLTDAMSGGVPGKYAR